MITVQMVPIFKDNYAYIIKSPCGAIAVLDPGHAAPIIKALDDQNLTPAYILNTHHHWDHVDGNMDMKRAYPNAKILAPEKDAHSIQGVDQLLKDNETIQIGTESAHIIPTPGHTAGGVCFYFPNSKTVFTGDAIFSMGCGRLFEGTAQDAFESFQRIMALPDDTLIYCGHEYTRANAGFCLAQDKQNEALRQRIEEVKALRAEGKPTLPVSLSIEKQTNVFMKAKSAEEFAALRKKKDAF